MRKPSKAGRVLTLLPLRSSSPAKAELECDWHRRICCHEAWKESDWRGKGFGCTSSCWGWTWGLARGLLRGSGERAEKATWSWMLVSFKADGRSNIWALPVNHPFASYWLSGPQCLLPLTKPHRILIGRILGQEFISTSYNKQMEKEKRKWSCPMVILRASSRKKTVPSHWGLLHWSLCLGCELHFMTWPTTRTI